VTKVVGDRSGEARTLERPEAPRRPARAPAPPEPARRAERPGLGAKRPEPEASASGEETARAALLAQEIQRARAILARLSVLAVAGVFAFALGRGTPLAKSLCVATLTFLGGTAAWSARAMRESSWYTARNLALVSAAAVGAAMSMTYYVGVLSFATVFLIYVPIIIGMGSVRTDWVMGACVVGYALLAAGAVTGIVPDVAAVGPRFDDAPVRFVGPLVVEVLLVLTFLSARRQRTVALSILAERVEAVRSLAQREAMLLEARQELERALHCEGLGRFSDSTIGSFRLGKVIGRGAAGEVYEAHHTTTGSRAAVKLLTLNALGMPEVVKRFLREARIAASLDVPNVVRVIEVGGLDSSLPYIAMERLSGEDLADHLRKVGPMPLEEVIGLVAQVGSGLEAAHAAGIVHRDLKPRNIFVAHEGVSSSTFKILDFGVSKLADAEGTVTHGFVGTPGYMAPEQAAGGPITHRADLFSLGVLAYRALTGRPAFAGEGVAETIQKVMSTMPPRPSQLVRVHANVDLVFAIAMAKDPSHRFASGGEMARALDVASAGELSLDLIARAESVLRDHPWRRPESV
jgi:tRNA A-37 threonylcarbamoyl transferase component Bud32